MIGSGFDRLAPHYAWIEAVTFAGRLHRCRTALLAHLTSARRVLVLGEGDGRFLSEFLDANLTCQVDVIDVSPAMIASARQRLARRSVVAGRVCWQIADARQVRLPTRTYDLVITNFFLDCFPARQLDPLIARLAQSLRPGGWWLVGDFAIPEGRFRAAVARLAIGVMYGFFKLVTRLPAVALIDPKPLLLKNGLILESQKQQLGGFLVSSLWRSPTEQADQ